MARIRTVKPEFWASHSLAQVDFFSRLLFIALFNFADDEGRGRAITKEINGFAFPNDDNVTNGQVEKGLSQLFAVGCIRIYEHNSSRYYDIPSWSDHQVINRPSASRIPCYEDSLNTHGILSDNSLSGARAQEVEKEKEKELGNRNAPHGAKRETKSFQPPSIEAVTAFFVEKGSSLKEAELFEAHYASNGWHVGKSPMKDWEAAARGWIGRGYSNGTPRMENKGTHGLSAAQMKAEHMEILTRAGYGD